MILMTLQEKAFSFLFSLFFLVYNKIDIDLFLKKRTIDTISAYSFELFANTEKLKKVIGYCLIG